MISEYKFEYRLKGSKIIKTFYGTENELLKQKGKVFVEYKEKLNKAI